MNVNLKLAIFASGKTQRQVAAETRLLSENRLSEIVRGWTDPREEEKQALARVLNRSVDALFDKNRAMPARVETLACRRRPTKPAGPRTNRRCDHQRAGGDLRGPRPEAQRERTVI